MALVAPKHDGRIDFQEFLEFWLRGLPACRGYCRDCGRVIVAGERPGGFVCNKCRAPGGNGFLTSSQAFMLCWDCCIKKDMMPHKHPREDFSPVVGSRSFMARVVSESVVQGRSHLSDSSGRKWYRKMILRPMLEARYKAEGDPGE
eukprot:evm.model.scf_3686.1 EVM.evm.TU.scf_3686.1   scf_3686:4698-5804(-)